MQTTRTYSINIYTPKVQIDAADSIMFNKALGNTKHNIIRNGS